MLRAASMLRARRPIVDPQRVAALWPQLGLEPGAYPLQVPEARDAVAPLFAPGTTFVLERGQHVAVGDAVVADVVARAIAGFTARREMAVTTPVAAQLAAVWRCHHTLRLNAERLGLVDLANASSPAARTDPRDAAAVLAALERPARGPEGSDLWGTSLDGAPHTFAGSDAGPALSHLLGCIDIYCGAAAAATAAERALGLDDAANLPHRTMSLVVDLVGRYPPEAVARGILAVQGYTASFAARSVAAPLGAPGAGPVFDTDGGEGGAEADADPSGAAAQQRAPSDIAVRDPGPSALSHGPDTVAPHEAHASLAAGPGGVDMAGKWLGRNGAVLPMGEGWVAPDDQSSPYDRNAVKFPSGAVGFFADAYAVPQPQQGLRVSTGTQHDAVRDPSFYDAAAGKDGLTLDTKGLPLAEYLQQHSEPHLRRFEVTMAVEPANAPVAVAVASRYTAARAAASRRYLERVMADMARIADRRADDEGPTPA